MVTVLGSYYSTRGGSFNPRRGCSFGSSSGQFVRDYNHRKPVCQLCNRICHEALQYYYRFDRSFVGPSQLQQRVQSPFHQFQYEDEGTQSDSYHFDHEGNLQSQQMTAMLATPESIHDSSWYPDSGAPNHLTAEADNLMHKSEYYGNEQVHMGNAKGITY